MKCMLGREHVLNNLSTIVIDKGVARARTRITAQRTIYFWQVQAGSAHLLDRFLN